MLDVHPPHHSTRSWTDFFIHIATIVVGLLIAIVLEQTVEYLHHRHLVQEFEEQMREEFATDRKTLDRDVRLQSSYRLYLSDLQKAINAKLEDRPFAIPSRDDPRNNSDFYIPQLSAYYVANQNGTLSHMDARRLGLYAKIARQHEVLIDISQSYRKAIDVSRAFRLQYADEQEAITVFAQPRYADVRNLSKPELLRYREIIADLMAQIDTLTFRFKYMNTMIELVQEGVSDEVELSKQVRERLSAPGQVN